MNRSAMPTHTTPYAPQFSRVLEAVRERGGKVSDRQLSEETGAAICTIVTYRRHLGIPAYTGRGWERRGARDWSKEDLSLPAKVLAERTGCSPKYINTIQRERRNARD